jgi:hypothetical protein
MQLKSLRLIENAETYEAEIPAFTAEIPAFTAWWTAESYV